MECTKPFLVEVTERLCIGQYITAFDSTKKFRCFKPQKYLKYHGFCDDFGPMNFVTITRFMELLDRELKLYPSSKIAYLVDPGRREMTNSAFLLGSYMIIKLNMSADDVLKAFSWLNEDCIEEFRDATFSAADFRLSLKDCWRGLEVGKLNGWAGHPDGTLDAHHWGMIDPDEYSHWDDPLNGDFHMVVPGKFIAFRGPHDLNGKLYSDDEGYRRFSPTYYADVFRELGIKTVVRLNEPEYDKEDFENYGISHHDLYFDDCTSPPENIVRQFFDIVDASSGPVAVHCKAGLGRTGTLIALYMMRSCGFCAREAMGWLRIMRPGSVIGEQQHYLCAAENKINLYVDARRYEVGKIDAVFVAAARSTPADLARQVAHAMERRGAVTACVKSCPALSSCIGISQDKLAAELPFIAEKTEDVP